MAITFSHLGPTGTPFYSQQGRWRECLVDLVLDNSYPSGGYPIPSSMWGVFGMLSVIHMEVGSVNGPSDVGLLAQWDRTNRALLITPAEPTNSLVVEESVTISANAGRLANVPGYVVAVQQKAGGTTGASTVVPTGSTLATLQTDINFTTGAVKTFATDAVTQLLVSYIPMGVGPFIPANMVVDESVALPNGTTVNLANQADLVQYVYDVTGAIPLPIVGTTNAPGSGQIQLNLANGANTTITDNAAQNGHTGKATYWKHSAFGASFDALNPASVTATSNVIAYSTAAGIVSGPAYFIPGYGVHHAAYATNTDKPSLALGPSGTPAANTPVFDPIKNQITFAAGDSITREFTGGIFLNPMVMGSYSGGSFRQVPIGTNLSAFTVRARVVGF